MEGSISHPETAQPWKASHSCWPHRVHIWRLMLKIKISRLRKERDQSAEQHAVTDITTPAGSPCSYTGGFQDSKEVTGKDKPVPCSPLPKTSQEVISIKGFP